MPRREDDVAPRSAPRPRTLFLAGGFVLALVATLAVFLTDNPRYLRVAVVAVAWAFVLATFAAGRRGSEGATAALRVSELRRAYELELEREVAARREYELELEKELRRENQEAMREELDALRTDLAALATSAIRWLGSRRCVATSPSCPACGTRWPAWPPCGTTSPP